MVRISLFLAALLVSCGAGVPSESVFEDTGTRRFEGRVTQVGEVPVAFGEWTFWYASGEMQAQGEFEEGEAPGTGDMLADRTVIPSQGRAEWWSFWDEEGRLTAEGDYEEGLRDDLWVTWYENGQHCCTGSFAADLEDGYHVHWDPEGRKRDTRYYVEGQLSGQRLIFDEHGEVIWSGEYVEGELVSSDPPGAREPDTHSLPKCLEGAEVGLLKTQDPFPAELGDQMGQ